MFQTGYTTTPIPQGIVQLDPHNVADHPYKKSNHIM